MVSKKNKEKLRRAARKAGSAAKEAGRLYMEGSEKAGRALKRKLEKRADEAQDEADDVVRNAEPNDPEDVELYRLVEKNHAETKKLLRQIERNTSELEMADPSSHGGDELSGFGFGFAPDGQKDSGGEFDYTRWL